MSWSQFLGTMPPETLLGFVGTAITLLFASLGGAGYLFRKWFLGRLETERARTQSEIEATKSKAEIDRMEIQNQLDQTQSGREMLRLQMSESSENRKAFLSLLDTMRQDAIQRDLQYNKHLGEITESFKGIQVLAASTLELLKTHREHDETMSNKQEKIILQNEENQRKITDIASDLATITQKLESISVGRASDRLVLDEIRESLVKMQESIVHIEAVKTITETNPISTEADKELSDKDA